MRSDALTPDVTAALRRRLRLRHARLPFPLLIGGFILLVFLVVAVTGHLWTPYDPTT